MYKILMIGQSLAMDTVWLLYNVLKAERPEEDFLVADIYASITLGQHRENILNNAPAYHYFQFSSAGKRHQKDHTIDAALRQEQWDLIIFNDATYPTTQAAEFRDGDHAFMIDHIRKVAAPGYKLAYNATWSNPTAAALNSPDRLQAPKGFRETYVNQFGGSRNLYYEKICENIQTYIETDPVYDYVFHTGTAIQYASETHGVPEVIADCGYNLYRDYVHLADFGRLIVAYQVYAQLFGLKTLDAVHVEQIKSAHRATRRDADYGDIAITQQLKDAIIASVNYALEHPNTQPPQTARKPAILEPI